MAHIGIRLSDQEKEMLEESAQQNDLTISQILRKLIRKYLGEQNNGWKRSQLARFKNCSMRSHQWRSQLFAK